ncbi:ABC transporter permease subunit [Carboxydochorda subterranea]|uniref:ABC transporter permease subunit n=1 Tax=Carboxydichorda subterranea TaxID=3109565 RepID=A0ABZ1BX78_9FIRM|nr:ABC transporter permease subunit [Limnochorda sp. L945t]WRP17220.1 ABC transporter permease subunit [Limnochorda sp. L945t]
MQQHLQDRHPGRVAVSLDHGPAVLALLALVGLWEAAVRLGEVSPWVLPAPSRVARALWESRVLLLAHAAPTLVEAAAGTALALWAGALFGAVVHATPLARRALYPLLVGTQSLPVIVVAPLLTIWLGYGILPKVVLVAFTGFFPIAVAVADGLQSAVPEMLRLVRSMGGGGWQLFWKVRVPSALPSFFTGVKVSITYALIAAVVSEWMGASEGLGVFMSRSARAFQTDRLFAAVVGVSALSAALFLAVEGLARFAMPWHYGRAAPRRRRPAATALVAAAEGDGPGNGTETPLSAMSPGAQTSRATLVVEGISKRFRMPSGDEVGVLEGVSLSVRPNELVALIGPSGCGKSTLLHIVAGVEAPDAGHIRLSGSDITGRTGLVRLMPQQDLLMPWRTVLGNCLMGPEVQRRNLAAARARALAMLPLFGLSGFEHVYPALLSGGMRQRASLLRTVLAGEGPLLLDEPFGALDALTRRRMWAWLLHVRARLGVSVLLITHDVEEAVALADRVYVLSPRPARVIAERRVRERPGEPLEARRSQELRHELLEALGVPPSTVAVWGADAVRG